MRSDDLPKGGPGGLHGTDVHSDGKMAYTWALALVHAVPHGSLFPQIMVSEVFTALFGKALMHRVELKSRRRNLVLCRHDGT